MNGTIQRPAIIDILHHFGDVVLEVNRDAYISEVWIKEGYIHAERAKEYKGHTFPEVENNANSDRLDALIKKCIETGKDQYFQFTNITAGIPSKYVLRVVALHEDK